MRIYKKSLPSFIPVVPQAAWQIVAAIDPISKLPNNASGTFLETIERFIAILVLCRKAIGCNPILQL